MVLPEPVREIEAVLRNAAEVQALVALDEVLGSLLNELGDSPGER